MSQLFDIFRVLWLHESVVDLYLRSVREAIAALPKGVLSLEEGCSLVVTGVIGADRNPKPTGVVLGYGFHKLDYGMGPDLPPTPIQGIALNLHPPASHDATYEVRDVKVHVTPHIGEMFPNNYSHFKVGKWEFRLTPREFDLDEVVCHDLRTGEVYKKPREPSLDEWDED